MAATRVLQVVSALHLGGAETMIMNLYRKIDTNKVQFDFLVFGNNEGYYEKEVLRRGGRIFRVNPISKIGIIEFIINVKKIIENNGPFQAIHIHTDYQAGLVALAAKMAGVEIRICHSHSAGALDSHGRKINQYLLRLLKLLINIYATHRFACGEKAAQFMFGKVDDVIIFRNAIEINSFSSISSHKKKDEIKKKYSIPENCKIIGQIGRFTEAKNHKRIVEVFKTIIEIDEKFILILIGEGPLKEEVQEYVQKIPSLKGKVIFCGLISDIYNIIKIFDVLLMPSLYEGIPVTLIEAQAAGVPCIVSNSVSNEVDIGLGLIDFISLESSNVEWANKVIDKAGHRREDFLEIREKLINHGYSIDKNIETLYNIYDIK